MPETKEAPERLWVAQCDIEHQIATYDTGYRAVYPYDHDGTEYIRLDLLDAAVEQARREVWEAAMRVANNCLQGHSHVVDEYGERTNPASCIWFALEAAAKEGR